MFYFSKILCYVVFAASLVGCEDSQEGSVTVVDVNKVKELMAEGVLIVDVRTPAEFEAGRLKGAQLINYFGNSFDQEIDKLDKAQPILVYCGVGGRSKKASEKLKKKGFVQIFDYQGGFNDWSNRGEEIEN